jgi:hypothetical protein
VNPKIGHIDQNMLHIFQKMLRGVLRILQQKPHIKNDRDVICSANRKEGAYAKENPIETRRFAD